MMISGIVNSFRSTTIAENQKDDQDKPGNRRFRETIDRNAASSYSGYTIFGLTSDACT